MLLFEWIREREPQKCDGTETFFEGNMHKSFQISHAHFEGSANFFSNLCLEEFKETYMFYDDNIFNVRLEIVRNYTKIQSQLKKNWLRTSN